MCRRIQTNPSKVRSCRTEFHTIHKKINWEDRSQIQTQIQTYINFPELRAEKPAKAEETFDEGSTKTDILQSEFNASGTESKGLVKERNTNSK